MTDQPYWTYWVAYRHRDGMGAVAASLGLPLRVACQLAMLAQRIERDEDVRDVVVLSWQELAVPVVDATVSAEGASAGEAGCPADAAEKVLPEAVGRVLAASERQGNLVSTLTLLVGARTSEISVHLRASASAEQADALLADLGVDGEPAVQEYRAREPFDVHSGEVEVAGAPVVIKVFCQVPR